MYEWGNIQPHEWHELIIKTFGQDGTLHRGPYKQGKTKFKDSIQFYFNDGSYSVFKYQEGWEWTWSEFITLVKNNLVIQNISGNSQE